MPKSPRGWRSLPFGGLDTENACPLSTISIVTTCASCRSVFTVVQPVDHADQNSLESWDNNMNIARHCFDRQRTGCDAPLDHLLPGLRGRSHDTLPT
jgi:hypothetical protein